MAFDQFISAALAASLVGGFLALLAGRGRPTLARNIAFLASFVPLALSIRILLDLTAPGTMAFEEQYTWIPQIGASYHVGLDGLSAPLFFLTALLVTVSILFEWRQKDRANEFFGLLLFMDFAVLGVFAALDYFLFYIFWEIVLIPMFLLILVWGSEDRRYASIKFFLYTFVASLVMLIGIMALYFEADRSTFDMAAIHAVSPAFGPTFQTVVFGALLFGFIVKIPSVPFHTWLPNAHVEAPTAGSVLLAGVLLKMGGYGILRIAIPALPFGAQTWVPAMLVLGIVSTVYGAIICLAQRDYKRLIAYSSVSHMGMVLIGIAAMNEVGLAGAMFMMFAHGLISPFLFMLAGSLKHGTGTRDIGRLGGLAAKTPLLASFFMAGSLASLGLPGMAGFIAEFQLFLATWEAFGWILLVPVAAVIITAAYYLWAMQRAFFGPYRADVKGGEPHDMPWYEVTAAAVLLALFVLYGILPGILMDPLNPASKAILAAAGVGS